MSKLQLAVETKLTNDVVSSCSAKKAFLAGTFNNCDPEVRALGRDENGGWSFRSIGPGTV